MELLKKLKKRHWQIISLSLLGILLLCLTYHLRSIFNPVLLSLLLAYILNPIVNFCEKRGIGRKTTIFCIYLILTSSMFFIVIFGAPYVGGQLSFLYSKVFIGDEYLDVNQNHQWDKDEPILSDLDQDNEYDPSYAEKILTWGQEVISDWNEKNPENKIEWGFFLEGASKKDNIAKIGNTLFKVSSETILTALGAIISFFSILSYLVLLPVYTFFLLSGLNEIRNTIFRYLPTGKAFGIKRVLYRIHHAASSFFRGKLIICIVKGLITWGILTIFGAKFALLFGAIQVAASIIPFLVLLVGMLPNIVVVCLEVQGSIWMPVIGIILLYMTVESIEGFVLTPWIMGKETGMHPLTVILSLMVGGKLFGVFGLILAIPMATTLKILGEELILPQLKEVLGHQDGEMDQV